MGEAPTEGDTVGEAPTEADTVVSGLSVGRGWEGDTKGEEASPVSVGDGRTVPPWVCVGGATADMSTEEGAAVGVCDGDEDSARDDTIEDWSSVGGSSWALLPGASSLVVALPRETSAVLKIFTDAVSEGVRSGVCDGALALVVLWNPSRMSAVTSMLLVSKSLKFPLDDSCTGELRTDSRTVNTSSLPVAFIRLPPEGSSELVSMATLVGVVWLAANQSEAELVLSAVGSSPVLFQKTGVDVVPNSGDDVTTETPL